MQTFVKKKHKFIRFWLHWIGLCPKSMVVFAFRLCESESERPPKGVVQEHHSYHPTPPINCCLWVQIHIYKYAKTNTKMQIHRYKYTNTNTQTQMYTYTPFIHLYHLTPPINCCFCLFDVTEHYLANIEHKHKSVGGKGL